MKRQSILFLSIATAICSTTTASAGLSLTFEGSIGGQGISFTVTSNVWDPPYTDTRNVEIWK